MGAVSSENRPLVGAVIVSLVITFLRTPLLNGTFAGLVVTVLLQLYLPGYLLARAVGKHRLPHPIARFAWILACGFGLTISLGVASVRRPGATRPTVAAGGAR